MMEATKEFIRVVDDFVVMRKFVNSRSSDEVIEAQFERLKAWQRLLSKVVREVQDAGGNPNCVTKLDAMVYSGLDEVRSPARISEYWLDCKAELRRTLMLARDKKPEAQLCVSADTSTADLPHPYKLYFAEYSKANPSLRYPEAAAAESYWKLKLCKNEKKKMIDDIGDKQAALKSFVRKFKYRLK